MTERATTDDEVAVFVPTPDGEILAIATRPTTAPNGLGILILQGGRGMPSFGRNRLWTDKAREWAAGGFCVGRFDYRGVGDSAGASNRVSLDAPYEKDALAVISWMTSEWNIKGWILMGSCFGARTALAAGSRLSNLSGLAFFPLPVRDFRMGEQFVSYPFSWYLRRVFRQSVWAGLLTQETRRKYLRAAKAKVRHSLGKAARDKSSDSKSTTRTSPIVLTELSTALGEGAQILLVYGNRDLFFEDFERALVGRLGKLLKEMALSVSLKVIDGKVHGLTSVDVQQRTAGELDEWLKARFIAGAQRGSA